MRYNLKTLLEEFVQGLEQSPSCPCASMFSWNQYSYVWNSRHSSGDGRQTSTADKCCKTVLKVYVSVTLFAAGETAWDGMFQRKQDKIFSFLPLLPRVFFCYSLQHFPLSSWECDTMRKLLIWEELLGWFSGYSSPVTLTGLLSSTKWWEEKPSCCFKSWIIPPSGCAAKGKVSSQY